MIYYHSIKAGEFTVRSAKNMKKFEMEAYRNLVERSGGASSENLFTLLGKIQDTFGYVPREAVCDLAARTGFSEARIYGALVCYRDFIIRLEADG